MDGVSASDALTMSDADGDGVDDYTVIGCIPESDGGDNVVDPNDGNDSNDDVEVDSDGDGVNDDVDDCLGTEAGAATDTQGCSNQQNKEQSVDDSAESDSSSGMDFMMTLIIIGTIVLLGAGTILLTKKKEEEEDSGLEIDAPEIAESKSWDMPVLDGTNPVEEQTGPDMSKFSGWSKEQVQNYLDSGWTEEQLAEWYKQQIDDNSA